MWRALKGGANRDSWLKISSNGHDISRVKTGQGQVGRNLNGSGSYLSKRTSADRARPITSLQLVSGSESV